MTTRTEGERLYVVDNVVKPSGRLTFGVWFGDSSADVVRDEVLERLAALGALFEWYSPALLAVSAENQELAQAAADFLEGKEDLQQLKYETGRTE